MTGNLREDQYTFMISLQFFLEWEIVYITFVEKIKTHVLCPVTSENRVVYEIMWKNIAEPVRPQMTIGKLRSACWITRQECRYIPTIFNTYCLCTATVVTRTRMQVTLYVLCLCCHFLRLVQTYTGTVDSAYLCHGCGNLCSSSGRWMFLLAPANV
jgi:hypothetical protein